jgi:hypothetical protein
MYYEVSLMRIIAVFILFLSFQPIITQAADKNGSYAIWGMGRKTCYSYNLAREAEDYVRYKDYMMGYLTAYNAIAEDTYRISGKMDLNDILEWMDDYCELKQVHAFELALADFINEHKDTRIKKARSKHLR